MSAIKISTCAPFSFSAAATALGTAKSYSRSTAMRTLLPGMVLLYPTNPMWLSRFSRQFASSRATGISLERSADRSPNRSSRSSFGTELLIPTPSSAVSHIEPPLFYRSSSPWRPLRLCAGLHLSDSLLYLATTLSSQRFLLRYRQCSLIQLTISIRLANQTSENDLAYLIASSYTLPVAGNAIWQCIARVSILGSSPTPRRADR